MSDKCAAVKLLKRLIRTTRKPTNRAYVHLGVLYSESADHRLAYDCFVSAYDRSMVGLKLWVCAAGNACATRAKATPCGSGELFCDCAQCSEFFHSWETPSWLSSPSALLELAQCVVTKQPDHAPSWMLHGSAHNCVRDYSTAANSFMKGVSLANKQRDTPHELCCIELARSALERLRLPGSAT